MISASRPVPYEHSKVEIYEGGGSWGSDEATHAKGNGTKPTLADMISGDYASHHASQMDDLRSSAPANMSPSRSSASANRRARHSTDVSAMYPELQGMTKQALTKSREPSQSQHSRPGPALSGWTNASTRISTNGGYPAAAHGMGSMWTVYKPSRNSSQRFGSAAQQARLPSSAQPSPRMAPPVTRSWEQSAQDEAVSHSVEASDLKALYRVVRYHGFRLQRKAWKAWLEFRLLAAWDRRRTRRALNMWQHHNLQAAWRGWQEYHQEAKTLKVADGHHSNYVLYSYMLAWMQHTVKQQEHRVLLARHGARHSRLVLRSVFNAWLLQRANSKVSFLVEQMEDLHLQLSNVREEASYASNALLAQKDGQGDPQEGQNPFQGWSEQQEQQKKDPTAAEGSEPDQVIDLGAAVSLAVGMAEHVSNTVDENRESREGEGEEGGEQGEKEDADGEDAALEEGEDESNAPDVASNQADLTGESDAQGDGEAAGERAGGESGDQGTAGSSGQEEAVGGSEAEAAVEAAEAAEAGASGELAGGSVTDEAVGNADGDVDRSKSDGDAAGSVIQGDAAVGEANADEESPTQAVTPVEPTTETTTSEQPRQLEAEACSGSTPGDEAPPHEYSPAALAEGDTALPSIPSGEGNAVAVTDTQGTEESGEDLAAGSSGGDTTAAAAAAEAEAEGGTRQAGDDTALAAN